MRLLRKRNNPMKNLIYFLALSLLFSCNNQAQINPKQKAIIEADPVVVPLEDGKARAYFASGCFWCVEAIYESVKGVDEVISGFSGGHTDDITYEKSHSGTTGHSEAVEVIYDPQIVSFGSLVDVYFGSQNPTQINGQGPDKGTQYRSIIFYQNDEQKQIIEKKKTALAKKLDATIAAEVYPFQKFYPVSAYHQDFEKRNPNHGYIRAVSIPRLNRFKAKFPELLKEEEKH